MADGITHERWAVRGVVAVAAASYFYLGDAGTWVIVGAIHGYLICPDYDVSHSTGIVVSKKRIASIPGIGPQWVKYWKLYSELPHRGLSHIPLLGTLSRLLYLYFPLIAWAFMSGGSINIATFIQIFIGWALIDMIHLALDGFKINAKIF